MRDEEWKNLRKILAPVFTSNKLKKMYDLMKRCTKNLQHSIDSQANMEVDLKKLFSVFTVDVISTCCFSMDLKDYRHPDSEILQSARKFFNVSRFKMAFSMAVPKQLLALCGFDINNVSSIDFFARFATEIINKRRKIAEMNQNNASYGQTKKQDDFLQTLMDAAAEFNSVGQEEHRASGTKITGTDATNERQQDVNREHQDTTNGKNSLKQNNNNNNEEVANNDNSYAKGKAETARQVSACIRK